MPLTAAEKSKRYREKIKQNPEKYEEFKKKELQRQKNHQKKIKDLTEEEKIEKRKLWREQKRKQKKNKNTQPNPQSRQTHDAINTSASRSLKIRYRKLFNNYKKVLKTVRQYNTTIQTLRKKLYRMKKKREIEIDLLNTENNKLKARQEIMEISIRSTYRDCKKSKEKQLFKNVIRKQAQISGKAPESKILGLKGRIRKRINVQRPIKKKTQEEIVMFYLRDDISKSTAGKKETRSKDKQKTQIRYLVDTLKNVYEIYKKDGGSCGFTTFYRYKPYYILSPSINNRETCLCIKHSNFEYMFNALKLKGVIMYKNIKELLNIVACDITRYDCMYNKCKDCKSLSYDEQKLNSLITWYKWARVNHQYEKSGKILTTKKTTKQQLKGTVLDLITNFQNELPAFKTHFFNWIEQQRQYRNCIKNMRDDEILILCDFSENFECKYKEEVQSMHFGASKNTITLHCGVIFWKNLSQSFVSVSDNNCHEPNAIWAHLIPVIKLAKEVNPNIKVIHFFSDGPCSQYRQKKNFYLLSLFTPKLKLSYSTWSFSEAGHGKSMADGIGGAVKRQLDKRISYGNDVTNATDAFQILECSMKTVKCFYISNQDIDNMNKLIPNNIQAVPGTMQLHQISTTQCNQIKYRELSCFCGDYRGLCSCYCPKTHNFGKPSIETVDFLEHTNVSGPFVEVNSITDSHQRYFEPKSNETDSSLEHITGPLLEIASLADNQRLLEPKSDENADFLEHDVFYGPLIDISSLTDNQILFETKFDSMTHIPESSCMAASDHVVGNTHNIQLKENLACLDCQPSEKRKINISKDNALKEKYFKSSRTFLCFICKERQPFIIQRMVKCNACKNWVCYKCSGTTFFDYICSICLGADE